MKTKQKPTIKKLLEQARKNAEGATNPAWHRIMLEEKTEPKEKTEKHSFEVPVDDLWIFFVKAREKRMKVKEAIAEAIRDWNKK